MSKTKVSSRGQTVIPALIRKKYGLSEGSRVEWIPWNVDSVIIRKVTKKPKASWGEWANTMYGLHKEVWNGVDPVKHTRDLWHDSN